MKRLLLMIAIIFLNTGCGDDSNKAVPPKGPVTPPPAGAEQAGGPQGKQSAQEQP